MRARSTDVDSVVAVISSLSALLLAPPTLHDGHMHALAAMTAGGGGSFRGGTAAAPFDDARRVQLLVRTLAAAVRAHAKAHTLLGAPHVAPPLHVLPMAAGLLSSERPSTLAAAVELVSLFCFTRHGRAALVSMETPLYALAELTAHEDGPVRASVLVALLALSEDASAYQALLRTTAVQGTLDLIDCERQESPGGPKPDATTLESGSQLGQALRVLLALIQHDAALLSLFQDHPAVEDLELDRLAAAWRLRAALAPRASSPPAPRRMPSRDVVGAPHPQLLGGAGLTPSRRSSRLS